MAGLSDYSADNLLNYITGRTAFPALPSVFMALFTAAPTSDVGTGGTEVVTGGTAYARQQVAGALTTNAATATGSTTLHFANVPSWIVALMYVFDTTSAVIPANTTVVSTVTGVSGTVTINQNPTGSGVGSADTIVFSAFSAASGSSGTEPSVTPAQITNNAVVTYSQATSGWGTVLAYGLYDAATAGNLLNWDYLGNYSWLPCTITSASPGVFTATANGYSTADTAVYTTKYGGTIPSFSQSNLTGTLAVSSLTADTFSVTNAATGVNTSSTGDGQVRKVGAQSVPSGVTASFAAGAIILTSA